MGATPQGEQIRILVIDDDPLFRSLIVSLLRKNCAVSIASDGQEGFNKALETPPHIALIDVQMPGWDGLATLKAFRGHPALAETKIMMLTGDGSKETVLAAIHGGANDYVIKTAFSKQNFFSKLNKLIPNRIVIPTGEAAPPQTSGKGADATATTPSTPHSSSSGAAQTASSNDDDGKLQELIDGWD